MLYDYGGFPAHTYEVVYPAPGDPVLATAARDLIANDRPPRTKDEPSRYDGRKKTAGEIESATHHTIEG